MYWPLTQHCYTTGVRTESIADIAGIGASDVSYFSTDVQYIRVCGGCSVSDSLCEVVGGVDGEDGAVLQPGNHCGWGASGDTCQSAGLLRVSQVGDGGPNWREGGKERNGREQLKEGRESEGGEI